MDAITTLFYRRYTSIVESVELAYHQVIHLLIQVPTDAVGKTFVLKRDQGVVVQVVPKVVQVILILILTVVLLQKVILQVQEKNPTLNAHIDLALYLFVMNHFILSHILYHVIFNACLQIAAIDWFISYI